MILTTGLDSSLKVFNLNSSKTEQEINFKIDRSVNDIKKTFTIDSTFFGTHDEDSP